MRPPSSLPPVVRIANGTFYRHHPSGTPGHGNPPLFSNLSFELPSHSSPAQHWCIVGSSLSGKTTLLQILRGQHLCFPPNARSFPYLATAAVPHRLKSASRAIRYVGFDAGSGSGGGLGPATSAYLSARYESRREQTDFSLRDFLLGNTQLNPLAPDAAGANEDAISPDLLRRVVADLRLDALLDLPVAFLSNGQGRRARIARALLTAPEALLLDEPFMGLDPPTVAALSPLLRSLAERARPRLVLSARPQDPVPEWVTHLAYLTTDCGVGAMGEKEVVLRGLRRYVEGVRNRRLEEDARMPLHAVAELGRVLTAKGVEGRSLGELVGASDSSPYVAGVAKEPLPRSADEAGGAQELGEPLVELDGCQVKYGDRIVLGNWTEKSKDGLVWTVRRGERWGVFGANGSGKTTIVSLLCSDHPQAYSLPLKLFGRSRLPEPSSGTPPLTFWDVQARVGHSSPEIHQHMPRGLTVRQVIESAWADTFRSKPRLDNAARAKVEATLVWFEPELHSRTAAAPAAARGWSGSRRPGPHDLAWADASLFGELSFSAQRVLLFLRAVVKHPDIVVLDEAFSGMDDAVRDKCMLFLEHGTEQKRKKKAFLPARASVLGREEGTIEEKGPTQQQSTVADLMPADSGGGVAAEAVVVKGLSERQALICISHIREEVPDCVREWLCLPESSTRQPARFGRLDGPLRLDERRWKDIWGM